MKQKGIALIPLIVVITTIILLSTATYFLVTDKVKTPGFIKETDKLNEVALPQAEIIQPSGQAESETTNENVYNEAYDEKEHDSAEIKPSENIENRILLIVIENNFSLSYEIEEDYQKYKFFVDMFLSGILKVDIKDLTGKSLVEIVDIYLEDYLAEQFKKAAKDYGKIVVLTDETASYNNFKKTLLSFSKENKTIDILLHLHGDRSSIYFYGQNVPKSFIKEDFAVGQKPLNVGFVYQTVCYGGENMRIWLDLGAKVVSGSKGVNNFVILAPEKFLNLWAEGKTYYNAVNEAFDFEVSNWKRFSRFLPGTILEITKDDLEGGRMIFLGEKDYSIK